MAFAPIRRGASVAMLLLVALVVACLLAPCVEGFMITPAVTAGMRRRAAAAGGAAGVEGRIATGMYVEVVVGWGGHRRRGEGRGSGGAEDMLVDVGGQ